MDPNPYESPRNFDPSRNQATTDKPQAPNPMKVGRFLFAIGWTSLLFLGLPAVQHIPLLLRLVSSAITLAAWVAMFTAFSGWRRCIVVPLAILLLFLQGLVWFFPFPGR